MAEKGTHYQFKVGDIVHHRRYGYRGVVFETTPACEADESWYQSNQTQPNREQPWYHVMVDGAMHTTYVAEANLEPDPTGDPIQHPLRDQMFQGYAAGRYFIQSQN